MGCRLLIDGSTCKQPTVTVPAPFGPCAV
jgi:hypothetical protein